MSTREYRLSVLIDGRTVERPLKGGAESALEEYGRILRMARNGPSPKGRVELSVRECSPWEVIRSEPAAAKAKA